MSVERPVLVSLTEGEAFELQVVLAGEINRWRGHDSDTGRREHALAVQLYDVVWQARLAEIQARAAQ